jgi:hypothetical protein
MTAGKLAASKPAATTNTTLYKCPIDRASSTVLEVCNQGGSASSYRVAIRDYDQILTLDSANYSLRKGNIISDYSIAVSPGIATTESDPGDVVRLDENFGTFKYHDILKPTSTITYDTKVVPLDSVSISPLSQIGVFSVGDVITGADTGLTALVYRVTNTALTINIDPISTADTTFIINDPTGILANDLLCVGGEVTLVGSILDYDVTVTRAQLGTAAGEHLAGTAYVVIRSTATTTTINEGGDFIPGDNTLTVTSSTGLSVGDYIRIGNEIITITSITGNDLGVIRGSLGTTPETHSDGATVTRFSQIVDGFSQFFELDEEISNGSGASVDLSVTTGPLGVFNPFDKFVFDFGTGDYEFTTSIPLDGDRIVRFTQVDSSNTGNTLRFSTIPDGTNAGGTEYTTGVVINGTAGTSGAYSQINLSIETLGTITQIYIYNSSTPQIINSGFISVDLTPNYNTVYVYDVEGTISVNDTFTINNVNYTITAVSSGAYGYIQDKTSNTVKVSLGTGSVSFIANDTFYDSPRTPGSDRTLATVSSVSVINDEDYIFYGKSINANTTDRNTGIVVGPGQSVMVYSADNTINYVVQGFEDITTDFTPVYYYRQQQTSPQ